MNLAQESSLFTPAPSRPRRANPGYARMFAPGRLTLGVMFPIEAFEGDTPSMQGQVALAQRAEAAGFAALWFRDVPLRVPSFGDTGQVFDPWVWLSHVSASTSEIALATGSIVLPLRHPLHVAKAAASVDRLSGGRLVLGVASGDRPDEFPAFGVDAEARGEIFRERFELIRTLHGRPFPSVSGAWGAMHGIDLVPKPIADGVPMLVTGRSRQSLEWIARHADGWITYPRSPQHQLQQVEDWREAIERERPGEFLPFAQSLYIDLEVDADAPAAPIHLGWRLGRNRLRLLLQELGALGVSHVALNLKYGRRDASQVLEELARHIVGDFR
jgi:luciferase-type oxidoreductase